MDIMVALERYKAEIERLEADKAAISQTASDYLHEIERLKAGMHEYACTSTDKPCGCYDQFLSEKAEIERLRAALQKIVDEVDSDDGLSAWDGSDIAREALGGH